MTWVIYMGGRFYRECKLKWHPLIICTKSRTLKSFQVMKKKHKEYSGVWLGMYNFNCSSPAIQACFSLRGAILI